MNSGFFYLREAKNKKPRPFRVWVGLIRFRGLALVEYFLDGFYGSLHIWDGDINVGWSVTQGDIHGVDTNDWSI